MKKKIDYKKLDELCRQSIEDYDEKVSIAWGYMDRMRCPLWMAAPELVSEMQGALEDNEIEWEDMEEDIFEEIIGA